MGWSGKLNGELLALAAGAGFDALITKDTNLPYQQDLDDLPIALVVLRAASNDLDDIKPLVPALLEALKNLPPNAIIQIG